MSEISLRRFSASDADWVIKTHIWLYHQDEAFDESFDAVVTEAVKGFVARHNPRKEKGWIATSGTKRVGSIFLASDGEAVAKIRLFLLLAEFRGRGLGHRLLTEAMKFARSAGYQSLQISTFDRHSAAGTLYRRSGFDLVAEKPTEAFGQKMVEQLWEIRL